MQILNRNLEQRVLSALRGRQGMKRRQTQGHGPNLNRVFQLLLSLLAVFCVGVNSAWAADSTSCHTLTDPQVAALFDRWNAALATGDPAQVSALYRPDALLLPTLSNQARTTTAEIEDYFKGFLSKHPTGRIDERVIQSDCNVAIDAGNYSFELDGQGWVRARYTFVYAYQDGAWSIEHHHSSLLP